MIMNYYYFYVEHEDQLWAPQNGKNGKQNGTKEATGHLKCSS